MIKTHFKSTNIKLILIGLFLIIIYFLLTKKSSPTDKKSRYNSSKFNAFIVTENCLSPNFNRTKTNIELVLPNLFSFICYPIVSLTDSRIHTINLIQPKRDSANVLTYLDLWTYKIPEESQENEYQWSFIFEDDVHFNNTDSISLSNYIEPLKQLMINEDIQKKDGFFYLGICRPSFDNQSSPLIYNNSGKLLFSQKGRGFCRHAIAITSKRAQLLWTEISSYRPISETTIDGILHDYCLRSGTHFYIFGTNLQNSAKLNQTGIAFKETP